MGTLGLRHANCEAVIMKLIRWYSKADRPNIRSSMGPCKFFKYDEDRHQIQKEIQLVLIT